MSFSILCLVQVFSAFGPVLKIAMFDKNGGVQALIQYPGDLFNPHILFILKKLVNSYTFPLKKSCNLKKNLFICRCSDGCGCQGSFGRALHL